MANKTDIMRLLAKGVGQSDVALRLRCSKTTVSKCAQILKERDFNAAALTELDEASIRQSYFARPERVPDEEYVTPDFESICKRIESNRKLTLKEVWIQYSSNEPCGKKLYSYSQFCRLLREWGKKTSTTTRMRFVAGQVAYIDWAGDTGFTTSRTTGRKQKVYLFVVCLPYSDIIYAEGFYSLAQEQWLEGHMNAFEYYGGVPNVLVPDNCSTAVDRTPTFVTVINQTYFDFADFYGTAVDPARVGRPRDKNLVESAVNLVEQWIIASLAEDTFYTLEEYNAEVRRKIDWLNDRDFQQKDGSRRSVFEDEERECLNPLPASRFEISHWTKATLAPDCHIRVDYMRYSAPYQLVGKRLDVRLTSSVVDIIDDGVVVASHRRKYGKKGQFSTEPTHMASTWGALDNPWNPKRFERWADNVGPNAREAIDRILASRTIIEQAFVPCQNVLGLAKTYGRVLLEQGCLAVVSSGPAAPTYTAVKNAIISIKRDGAAANSPVKLDSPKPDKLGPGGRTRGAEHYRHSDKGGDGSC
jgi:transposase